MDLSRKGADCVGFLISLLLRVRGTSLSMTAMKWKINADFGQPLTISLKNKDLIRDESGKTIKFDSPIDAIHYLNSRGWELVTATGSFESFSAVMKKPVTPQ